MRIGDERRVQLHMDDGTHHKVRVTGKVVYIDPKGRWYTVEVSLPGGTYRESFSLRGGDRRGRGEWKHNG